MFVNALIVSRGYKVNIHQLAKRVRRATRHGEGFLKVIARQSNQETMHKDAKYSVNRMDLAYSGLRQVTKVLRVAAYYLGNHNVGHGIIDATMERFQQA